MSSNRPVVLLALLATTLLTLALWGPSATSGLEATYEAQSRTLEQRLRLTPEQKKRVDALLAQQLERERYLRRQMRTTYTPAQQQQARRLWEERRRRPLTDQERAALWDHLGVSPSQRLQFQAYQEKLARHREQTLLLLGPMVTPSQQPWLAELSFAP